MTENEEKLLKIEQSIINKIENKTDGFEEHIKKFEIGMEKFGRGLEKGFKNFKHLPFFKGEKEKLNPKQKYELKKHSIRSEWKTHLIAFLSVNAFLFIIWFLTGAAFPWFYFPLGGWAIGLFCHFAETKSQLRKLDIMYKYRDIESGNNVGEIDNSSSKLLENDKSNRFNEIGNKKRNLPKLKEPYILYVKESDELSSSLMSQINDSKNVEKNIIGEIKSSLIHYNEKISYLARRGNSLDEAVEYYDKNPIENHRLSIEEQLKSKGIDEDVKKEYENALRLLGKQETSMNKLKKVRATINARLKTSLITLRNLQLDFVRLQYISDESASDAIQSLNKKTEEIDEYIDLLSDSLKDIDSQI